ncbi:dioxygenase [Rhodococcus sp. NPDC003318]|uniref:dioxygenase family protein n=1 Tax=Rhodococcus sp. NPDC003318 TaxID=3364503 RepID=UPI0036975938
MPNTAMPALYLSHGAPPLVDDTLWVAELAAWSKDLPRPTAVLMVSAHWESAPFTIGSVTTGTPLVYDFGGFDPKYYQAQYAAPGAPDLARQVAALMPDDEPVYHQPDRGLDHGAYVPLTVMYPDADIPVLQISLPTLDPQRLLHLGERLRPLREQGVLIVGSGFTTHGLPFLRDWSPNAVAPGWSKEFDIWAAERFAAGDVDSLIDFRAKAPGMPYAHPTIEHFAPLFVTLGASSDPEQTPEQVVDGFWMGLSKRSLQLV